MTSAVLDHFALFELPRSFSMDGGQLERRYLALQSKVHPDKHAHLGDSERLLALQRATDANAAFQTLKHPLQRATYLLHLAGHDVAGGSNTAMPPDFLAEQMELREAVVDARAERNESTLERLRAELKSRIAAQYGALEIMLDQRQDYPAAADMVRRLMFQEKLLQEIDNALEAIEA